MNDLEWANIDLKHITKPAWDQYVLDCNKSLVNAAKMMRALIKAPRPNPALDKQYERTVDKYISNIKLLSFVAPAYVQSFVETIRERISFAYSKLDKLLVVFDTVRNDSLVEQFLDELARYNVASDLYSALSGIEFSGIKEVDYGRLEAQPESREPVLADYLDDAFEEVGTLPAAADDSSPTPPAPIQTDKQEQPKETKKRRPAKRDKPRDKSQLNLF